MYFMKHMPLLFIFSLFLFVGCQESTKKSSSNSNAYCSPGTVYQPGSACYCQYYPTASGCYGSTSGTTTSGTTTGSSTCTTDYYTNPSCPGYCQIYPTASTCSGTTTGGTTGGTTTNPYPNYFVQALSKNWAILYPYVPSISCSAATAPTGISYTPYETRKGTVTLTGGVSYDLPTTTAFFDTTTSLLQTVGGARNFFWGDSTLKVRFISNVQPSSANTSSVCPGRRTGLSSIRGYGKLRFDLYLVGRNSSNVESTVYLGNKTVSVNSCTPAIDLSSYAEIYTNGIYLRIKNVQSNQNWSPGSYYYGDTRESDAYNNYGFIYPQNSYVGETWGPVRTAECWSLDIEVAGDGTKTFN